MSQWVLLVGLEKLDGNLSHGEWVARPVWPLGGASSPGLEWAMVLAPLAGSAFSFLLLLYTCVLFGRARPLLLDLLGALGIWDTYMQKTNQPTETLDWIRLTFGDEGWEGRGAPTTPPRKGLSNHTKTKPHPTPDEDPPSNFRMDKAKLTPVAASNFTDKADLDPRDEHKPRGTGTRKNN